MGHRSSRSLILCADILLTLACGSPERSRTDSYTVTLRKDWYPKTLLSYFLTKQLFL